jgi:hypothetical protein
MENDAVASIFTFLDSSPTPARARSICVINLQVFAFKFSKHPQVSRCKHKKVLSVFVKTFYGGHKLCLHYSFTAHWFFGFLLQVCNRKSSMLVCVCVCILVQWIVSCNVSPTSAANSAKYRRLVRRIAAMHRVNYQCNSQIPSVF